MAGLEATAVANQLLQLSSLVVDTATNITDKWYQASQDMEAFKNMQIKLQHQSETWKEHLRSAGLSDERRVTQPLSEAIKCLDTEKRKIDRLQSNCCYFMFMFRAQPFPPVLQQSMKKVVDAFENIVTSLGEVSVEARAFEKYAENHPLHQITVDRRAVELSATQQSVIKHLNDKTPNHVVTLWGGVGSGKTTLARAVGHYYGQPENQTIFADGAHILSCGHNTTLESICKELFQYLDIQDVDKDSAEHGSKPKGSLANSAQGQSSTGQSLVNRLRRRLKERHLLIILDDVSDPELLKDKLIVPHEIARDVQYLITSQSRGIYEDAKMVPMEPPSLKEAMNILGNYIPDSPNGKTFSMDNLEEKTILKSYFRIIIEKANFHPMTLTTIALRIDDFNDDKSWDEVLNNFNDLLLSSGHTSGDRMNIAMRMAVDALSEKHDAKNLLYLMAMCGPLHVPEVVLQILFQHIDPKQKDLKQVSIEKKFLQDRALINVVENYWELPSIFQSFILKDKKEEVSKLLYTLMRWNDKNDYVKESDIDDNYKLMRALCILYMGYQDNVTFTPIAMEAMENGAKEFNIPSKNKQMILKMRKALEPLLNLLRLSKEGSKDYQERRHRLVSKAIKQFVSKQDLDDESFQQLLSEGDIYEDICKVLIEMSEFQREDLPILANHNKRLLGELMFNLIPFSEQIDITLETLSALSHAANCDSILNNDCVLANLLLLLRGDNEEEQALALMCLSNLAKTSTAREKIASFKGLLEIVTIFYMTDYDITQYSKMLLKSHAVNALGSIAFQEETSTKLVKTPDFLRNIAQFLKDIYFKSQESIFSIITNIYDFGAQSTIQCLLYLSKGNDKNKDNISEHEDLMDILTKIFDTYNGVTTSSNDYSITISDEVAGVVIQLLTLINPKKYEDIRFNSIAAYIARGQSYAFQGFYEQAFFDFKRADSLDNSNEEFYKLKLCYLKAMLKDYDNATYYLKLVFDANPDLQHAWQESGVLKELMGDYKDAKIDLNKSLEISPNDYEALKHRAYVNFKLECIQEAQEDAEKALQVIPKYRVNELDYGLGDGLGTLSVPHFLDYDFK